MGPEVLVQQYSNMTKRALILFSLQAITFILICYSSREMVVEPNLDSLGRIYIALTSLYFAIQYFMSAIHTFKMYRKTCIMLKEIDKDERN